MKFPSQHVEKAVESLSKLPGIGKRTALRLALHLLKRDEMDVEILGNSLINMRNQTLYCNICKNISDTETCNICNDTSRNHKIICVVEDVRDVMAIENTMQYKGVYHVLGGVISPIEGISPDDLHLESLFERVKNQDIEEVFIALPTTIEGDTTIFFIYKNIKDSGVQISTIARGISIGNELEYTDEITLGRSIINRVPYTYDDED